MDHVQRNSEETLQKMAHMMTDMVPFSKYLNISVDHVEHGKVCGKIPFNESLVSEEDSGILHGGVVTTAIDNFSGLAALTVINPPQPLVTLDMRIDYNYAPQPEKDIFIEAECYRTAQNVSLCALSHIMVIRTM